MRPRRLVGASGRPLNFTVRAHVRFSVVMLALALTVAKAHDQTPSNLPELDPSQLLAQISKLGARRTLAIWLKDGTFDRVLDRVETGESDWLHVAVAIRRATDAGYSEMLSLSTGIALAKHPAEVLSIWVTHYGVEGTCGYPDISDPRTDSVKKAVAYVDARAQAVRDIHTSLARKCLKNLELTRRGILTKGGPFG
jgi:hypothetical protein